jgi:hypothetical protein
MALFVHLEGPNGLQFRIRVDETTMFSPAWTTNGTFDTYWSFQNTINQNVSGTLYLFTASGSLAQSVPFMIMPNSIFGTNTAALGIARSQVGNAVFTHDGPPGAVNIKGNQANFASSPPFIELVPFQPRSQIR